MALLPLWPVVLLGLALLGAGCSNIVPVLFTAAGRQTAVPGHVAVPALATMGYASSLPAALPVLAAGALVVPLAARKATAVS